jgi:hypothetical protein|tara:strand:- start:1637 stop:1918 length:282 start_codon:yes stop_codon:yes gene_type:complete
MSHPDPQHDPENVRIEDDPNAPRDEQAQFEFYYVTVLNSTVYQVLARSREHALQRFEILRFNGSMPTKLSETTIETTRLQRLYRQIHQESEEQ